LDIGHHLLQLELALALDPGARVRAGVDTADGPQKTPFEGYALVGAEALGRNLLRR
jgi:hypothetical protein